MLYQAHRGAATEFPENTLPAFVASKNQGYHIIECDPRFTADGQCVIHHDATINRTLRTEAGETLVEPTPINQVTYEQLQSYDAGLWMGEEFRGTKVPLLREVLAFAAEVEIPIKLDNLFSYFSEELRETLFREVEESGAQVGFTCADEETVRAVVERFPSAEIHYDGAVTEEAILTVRGLLKNNPLTVWIPLDCPGTSWCKLPKATEALCTMVKGYARLGIWLLDTQEQLEQAYAFGADIIETNGALKP